MTDTCRKILVDLNKLVDFSEPWGKCECFADPSGMDDICRRVTAILSESYPDPALPADLADLITHARAQCNRHVNGICMTRKCLIRGGWKPDRGADYSLATCLEKETAEALTTQSAALAAARAENERLREALTELVRAVETTVNEKGGGGFILARLSDARAVLAEGG